MNPQEPSGRENRERRAPPRRRSVAPQRQLRTITHPPSSLTAVSPGSSLQHSTSTAVSSPRVAQREGAGGPLPPVGAEQEAQERGRQEVLDTMQSWADSYSSEQQEAEQTLRLAHELFVRVVANGSDDAHPSATRAAVSCLMLEQICAIFGRYNSVLGSVSNTIMRSIYVPDVPEMKELLGTVDMPLSLPRGATEAESLLRPYARKPYFVAFEDLSAGVTKFARNNRSIEVRLSRQTQVFDSTVKHWMSSLVRNFFASWRMYTKRRNMLRAKYRSVFSRLRTDDCKIRAIRRWRDRAAKVRRMATADSASSAELNTLRMSTQKMQEQIAQLTNYNASLNVQVEQLDAERVELQASITEKERQHSELVHRGADMERAGGELIDRYLMHEPPPTGGNALEVLVNWAHNVIETSGGMIDGSVLPLQALLDDEFTVRVPPVALAAVMHSFNSDRAPSREAVVQIHMQGNRKVGSALVEMFSTLTEATCPINDEQLDSGNRGATLLFLASLMRFQAHWTLCKPAKLPVGRVSALPKDWTSWPERVKIQQQWINVSLSALHSALEVSLSHPHLLGSEESADLPKFLSMPVTRIEDILPSVDADECYVQVFKGLNRLYPEIRKVYYAYAAPALLYYDFIRLLKDCKLIGDKMLHKRSIHHVCTTVWAMNEYQATSAMGEEYGVREITPLQFVEALVRVALLYNRRMSHDPTLELSAEMVNGFISECIIPHSLRSDVDRFKQAFRHPLVQQQISQHKIPLRRAFGKYATEERGEGLNKNAFHQMSQDCKWLNKSITVDVIAEVFKRCQQSEGGSVDIMDLNEWLEALAALSLYSDPNPFVPLHAKIGTFVEEKVLSILGL